MLIQHKVGKSLSFNEVPGGEPGMVTTCNRSLEGLVMITKSGKKLEVVMRTGPIRGTQSSFNAIPSFGGGEFTSTWEFH
jgi:hypothetical protein